jgi:hypothetical protein
MAQTFKGSSRLACTVFDGWRRPQQNAFDYSLLQVPLLRPARNADAFEIKLNRSRILDDIASAFPVMT